MTTEQTARLRRLAEWCDLRCTHRNPSGPPLLYEDGRSRQWNPLESRDDCTPLLNEIERRKSRVIMLAALEALIPTVGSDCDYEWEWQLLSVMPTQIVEAVEKVIEEEERNAK